MKITVPTFLALCFFLYSVARPQEISFSNEGEAMGIDHSYTHSGVWGGGISFFDFDRDGLDDITFATGRGEQIHLYHNNDGSFTNIASSLDPADTLESQSVLWIDIDNDGFRELFISSYTGPVRLYRYDGNTTFEDITVASGLPVDMLFFSAAAWADYDNDGWLDLYLTDRNIVQPNRLYRNLGDATFADMTGIAGAEDLGQAPLAVSFLDYDNDGWQDIYLANDHGLFNPGNTLLRNNGDGTFSNVSDQSNTGLHYDAMGIAIGDYDDNGFLDMYISNGPAGNGLLRNNGDGTFTEIADSLGIAVNKVCWGVNFFDMDNDTYLDLYACVSGGTDTSNVLFANNGNGTFSPAENAGLEQDDYQSFSITTGDYNNDGFPDMAVLNEAGPSCLWKNSGGSNNWIKLDLEGTVSNRDAIGSVITINAADRRFIRSTHAGISYLGQNSHVLTIGIGTATLVDSLTVQWPGGLSETVYDLPANQDYRIVELEGLVGVQDRRGRNHLPASADLFQNYPNPFNPQTVIGYSLYVSSSVTLDIYNIAGEKIRQLIGRSSLLAANQDAGHHSVTWDGANDAGRQVASGVYIYRLTADRLVQTRKMILLR